MLISPPFSSTSPIFITYCRPAFMLGRMSQSQQRGTQQLIRRERRQQQSRANRPRSLGSMWCHVSPRQELTERGQGVISGGTDYSSPLALRKGVVEVTRGLTICYQFAFGISCVPKGWSFVHRHIPLGRYHYTQRYHRRAFLSFTSRQRSSRPRERWPSSKLIPMKSGASGRLLWT